MILILVLILSFIACTSQKVINTVESQIKNIPVPESSINIKNLSITDEGTENINYKTELSVEELNNFYDSIMLKWNWNKENIELLPNVYSYKGFGENNGMGAIIGFEKQGNSTIIVISKSPY